LTHKINNEGTAAVSLDAFWIPIDANTPHGVKLWLINRHAGSAYPAQYNPGDDFPTHWHPNPKFKD